MAIKTTDLKNCTLQLGLYTISEFEAGGMEFKLTKDLYSIKEGAGGEISRSRLNGIHGELIIRLKQTSASNTDLNALYLLDQAGNAGVVPGIIKDNNSDGELITSPNAFVKGLPVIKYVQEEEMKEWTIFMADCFVNIAGYSL